MKKTIILGIILLLLIGGAIAVTEYITTFTTGNSKENLTFTGGGTQYLYVDIPRYAYINSFTINVTGYNQT